MYQLFDVDIQRVIMTGDYKSLAQWKHVLQSTQFRTIQLIKATN